MERTTFIKLINSCFR